MNRMDDALATQKTLKSGGTNLVGVLAGTVFSGCPAHHSRPFRRRHRVKEDPTPTIVERIFNLKSTPSLDLDPNQSIAGYRNRH